MSPNKGPIQEQALVRSAAAGDHDAFGSLVESAMPALRTMARRALPSGDWEDAVQEAILKAYLNLNGFREQCRFSTWLLAILRNEVRSVWRRSGGRTTVEFNDSELGGRHVSSDPDQMEVFEHAQRAEKLHRLLSVMPPRFGRIVSMHDLEGKTLQEIHMVLGIPPTALRTRLYRGRKRLESMWRVTV